MGSSVKPGTEGRSHTGCISLSWALGETGQGCVGELMLRASIGANQPDMFLNGISSHMQQHAYRSQPGDSAVMFSDNISGGNQL